ncbi:MAG: UDP-3-O-acyl-N-acetylglucosamine deacetylase, partial [Candidatus Omnitrophota bacterium]
MITRHREKQKTIQKEVSLSGIGLHTANKVNIKFKPADVDCGINFVRTDMPDQPKVRASIDNLLAPSRSPRRTSVGYGNVEIQTIEHLMAALAGIGIDNLNIEIDNNEIPGLDGSSLGFFEILNKAGIKEQEKDKDYFAIKEPVYVEEDGACIVALPESKFRISYTLSYEHPMLKSGYLEVNIDPELFKKGIAAARTFCLENEAAGLQNQGMGQGANYENTLVVGKEGVIKNKLRFDDEFTRHKILDLLGDLYLLGSPIKGHIIALRSGHSLNLNMVKKLNQQKQRYTAGGVGVIDAAGCQFSSEGELGIEEIKKILPHRDPFLFVDKVLHLEEGKRATGLKNLSKDDYFFKGHFPGRPV